MCESRNIIPEEKSGSRRLGIFGLQFSGVNNKLVNNR